MNLIDYNLPSKLLPNTNVSGSKRNTLRPRYEHFNWKRHQVKRNCVAHAHFIKGEQVFDKECNYCRGVEKPKKTPEEIAQKERLKRHYIKEWQKRSTEDDFVEHEQHLRDIMKYG